MSRTRPNFSTRTAQEDVARLDPNEQTENVPTERTGLLQWPPTIWSRHDDSASVEPARNQRHSAPASAFAGLSRLWNKQESDEEQRGSNEEQVSQNVPLSPGPLRDSSVKKDKNGHRRSIEESKKLGTFSGVFVPTTLNVLSILMFLRFGFILGQAGLLGILGESSVRCVQVWCEANQIRATCRFIYDQLGHDNVSLRDCN